jgi:hypothetical protein
MLLGEPDLDSLRHGSQTSSNIYDMDSAFKDTVRLLLKDSIFGHEALLKPLTYPSSLVMQPAH